MPIKDDVILWRSEKDRLSIFAVPTEQQYKYIDGLPCITFGISYENADFKGYDTFTLFDHFYFNIINDIKTAYASLNGSFRIYDTGADTDGYIEFVMKNGIVFIKGQLGASFTSHALIFEFEADQTVIGNLLQVIGLE